MDNLETPYDDEAEFIECKVCEKSIRGETLYKIHLTTPGHMKKEDAIVAVGLAVRQQPVPVFEDIIQYLDYMKLDEPIIGLNCLEELPCTDPQAGPRYTCKLCHQTANLPEIVRHVIGRKHRQKYVELKRPDLVTWDKQNILTQGGKIIRARAEIIERQDGRGRPVLLPKKGLEGKLNSTVPPRQRQNRTHHAGSSHLPQLMAYQDEYPYQGSYPPGLPNAAPFHQEDSYMLTRDRHMPPQLDTHNNDGMEEGLRRADYREDDIYRRDNTNPNYHQEYEEQYVEDPQRQATPGLGGVLRYDTRVEMSRGQAQHVQNYPEETPPFRNPYPERDLLKEFYSEEVRRGQVCSAELSQPVLPEGDKQLWSLNRESGRFDTMTRAGRQGSNEPEAKRRSFPTPVESNELRGHLFNTMRDYCNEMREPHQEGTQPGPSRTGSSNSQRQVAVTSSISDIPEPFRRFLKGGANDEGQGKRKRKSRFSDATAEEVETSKEMFSDEYGPPNPKFSGRPVSTPLKPEIHRVHHPDRFTKSQGQQQAETCNGQSSYSASVWDMLKNIEIENAEEAIFLKNKLCDLLKEFKAKKSEKAQQQNIHGGAVTSGGSNNSKPDTKLPPGHQYDKILREDSDLRRPENLYFKEDYGGKGWKQHEPPAERLQEYRHPLHGEPRHPNSKGSCYEEVCGRQEMSLARHASHPDNAAGYPERFQERLHSRDCRPASEGFLGSSAPPVQSIPVQSIPVQSNRAPWMDRETRYSRNLDKLTSTLLELVSRK